LSKKTLLRVKVEHNISRLNYLLELFQLPKNEFLDIISQGLKTKITEEDIFYPNIKLDYLKRIDKIFNKGISYYLDPEDPIKSIGSSIFFRKKSFTSELNLSAKKIVNHFEDFKLSLSAIATLSDMDNRRTLPLLNIKQNAKEQAYKIRKTLNPEFAIDKKGYLKSLINTFAIYNILVFEFIETWNQKERANIDGVFLDPNVIVIKRQENNYWRREIFTLIHEFAHYLLNVEEIEKLDYDVLLKKELGETEYWCNEFAFYFLLGEKNDKMFANLPFTDESNHYNEEKITRISKITHLSKIAIYTRILLDKRITYRDYNIIKTEFDKGIKEYIESIKKKKELDKESGIESKGSAAKPIKSDLLISTVQTAFYEGVIDEYEVCKTLNISPKKITDYIQ
jgi:Zn-dependent peptidase ImmA (M78 family)